MVVNKTEIKENHRKPVGLHQWNIIQYPAFAEYAEFIHCSEWPVDQLKSAPKDEWFWLDSPTALQTQWHWLVDLSDMPWFLQCWTVHLRLAVAGQNGQTCRNIGLLERTESNIFLSHLLVNKPSLLTFRIFFLKGWSMGVTTFWTSQHVAGNFPFSGHMSHTVIPLWVGH